MFKPLLLAAALIISTAPLTQQAEAKGLNIDLLPGVSLRIGDQDQRGNYWDGHDWRDRDWWIRHQGKELGERSRRGDYWDGQRWRNADYWRKHDYFDKGRYRKYEKHHYKKHHKHKYKHRHHHH
ncbi:DUF2502 domain-containing protein [Serratia sp. NPDC078593]|uniref:DUF2502 domain-containing protein n=1 Tax=unclassified Serratia (in: enterobacteria) TaxID=2647522 RepID=UPI0037D2DCCC